jgi:hypothetical protein
MPNSSYRERWKRSLRRTSKLGAKRRISRVSAAHFGPRIVGNAGEALDFIGNVLATANEFSIVAMEPDGPFLSSPTTSQRRSGSR